MSAPEFFNPDNIAPPQGAYSHGGWVKAGSDLPYIAGQVGVRPDGSLPPTVAEQADVAYANLRAVLESVGLTPANIVKINTYCVAGQPLETIRGARRNALGDIRPASTFVCVPQLIEPKYLVEIEAVAAR
ncbi:MAG: RidA family protein [Hyphomonadaceae bacterium]